MTLDVGKVIFKGGSASGWIVALCTEYIKNPDARRVSVSIFFFNSPGVFQTNRAGLKYGEGKKCQKILNYSPETDGYFCLRPV